MESLRPLQLGPRGRIQRHSQFPAPFPSRPVRYGDSDEPPTGTCGSDSPATDRRHGCAAPWWRIAFIGANMSGT